jgi:hypothetical protein
MERSPESYCVVGALCAYVATQSSFKFGQLRNATSAYALLEVSVRARNDYDCRENPTYMTVLTSWFYYCSYSRLASRNTAWLYLSESPAQAQLLGMNDEQTYKHDQFSNPYHPVFFWLFDTRESSCKSSSMAQTCSTLVYGAFYTFVCLRIASMGQDTNPRHLDSTMHFRLRSAE